MSLFSKQIAVLFVSAFATLSAYALDSGTQIPTKTGYKAIKDIQVGDLVLSKNETTNQIDYQAVSNLSNHQYKETISLTIRDDIGNTQIIKTNSTHPFFVQSNHIIPATEGYTY